MTYDEPGSAELLTYPQLWAWTTMRRIVQDLYAPFMGSGDAWNDWYHDIRRSVNSTAKNARTRDICDASKANDTFVYTIAFEAPNAVMPMMRECASSPAYAFDVDGLEIADAFAAIASSIRQLRLTQ